MRHYCTHCVNMAEVASAPAPAPPSSGSSKDKEVPFDINDAAFSSDTFRIYEFKASKASGASPVSAQVRVMVWFCADL